MVLNAIVHPDERINAAEADDDAGSVDEGDDDDDNDDGRDDNASKANATDSGDGEARAGLMKNEAHVDSSNSM